VSTDNFDETLENIRLSAHGLLPPPIYRKLFDIAYSSGGGTFVEIGTAHGAATIALALGAQASQKPFHIYSVDPFSGRFSSRVKFGSVNENVRFVLAQFEKYGVSKNIDLVVGGCEDLLRSHQVDCISVLCLDADGRIDRDLSHLFEKLAPRCKIVIDVIDDDLYVSKINGLTVLDQKHRISAALSKAFVAHDLLRLEAIVENTGFYVKGDAQVTPDEIRLIALPAYRELVFAEIDFYDPAAPIAKRIRKFVRDRVQSASPLHRLVKKFRRTTRSGCQ
jgi:Methyltransferase domain